MSTLIRTTSSWLDGSQRKALTKVAYSASLRISGIASAAVVVARPRPAGDLAEGIQLVVVIGVRVLHRHPGAELEVLAHGLAERLVVWQAGFVERLQIELNEPLPLLVGDLQVAVHVDHVLEAELAREAIGAAKRLGREPRQVVDVSRSAFCEQPLQYRIGEDLVIEQLLEAVKRLVAAGMLEQRGHRLNIPTWRLGLGALANGAGVGELRA